MIDRIEELLSQMAAEDDEEEREDVSARKRGEAVSKGAWTVARASDGALGPRDRPESEGKRPSDLTALQRDNGAAKPRVANRRGVTTEALWKDGPVWTVRGAGPGMDEAQRTAAAQRTARTEDFSRPAQDGTVAWAGLERAERSGISGLTLDSVGWSGAAQAGLEQAGLKGLYQQAVRGLRPAAPALPTEQAGRSARAQEPGSTASLAVDELDRAVRRDSRRYDGGLSIY